MRLLKRISRNINSRFPPAHISDYHGDFNLKSHLKNLRHEAGTAWRSWPVRSRFGKKNRFVLYTRGRSGGTLLIDLLASHPQIACENYGYRAELLAFHSFFPFHYIEAKAALAKAETYGFKLKPTEISLVQRRSSSAFLQNLHRRGWKIVHLRRQNLLRQSLSIQIATQTQVWHHFEGKQNAEKSKSEKVYIESKALMKYMAEAERIDAEEDDSLAVLPHLSLRYEADLLRTETQNATANRVFKFLGLPPHDAKTDFVRTGSDDIFKNVENADELRDFVLASPYAHFLDD